MQFRLWYVHFRLIIRRKLLHAHPNSDETMTAFPHQMDAGADVNAQTRSDVDGDDAGTPLILASRFEVLSYK